MFLFRSLAIGLLGACVVMLASRPAYEVRVVAAARPPPLAAPPSAAIVDVAAGVPAAQLPALIALAPGEHVVSIGDRAVVNDLDAGAALAAADTRPGGFLDLSIDGARGSRRVLVLLH